METPSSTVAVRGTAFDVEVDEEGTTYVWVDSGEVVVENSGGSLVVQPGQVGGEGEEGGASPGGG